MTAVEGLPPSPVPRGAADHEPAMDRLRGLCPYLASADGSWRSVNPVRDHRCTAVSPSVPLTVDKQRRLCLAASHAECATYQAAAESHAGRRQISTNRPIARMTLVVLDQARFELRVPEIRADRATGQAVLVGALAVALAALLLARPAGDAGSAANGAADASSGGGSSPAAIDGSPATPNPDAPSSVPTPDATQLPTPSPEASQAASAAPTQSPVATPSPAPSTSGATYRVRSGDTLVAIAARFDTTVSVLVDLNDIDDPARLKVGQILKLP